MVAVVTVASLDKPVMEPGIVRMLGNSSGSRYFTGDRSNDDKRQLNSCWVS